MVPLPAPPREISPDVLAFCRQLDPDREPVRVPVRPAPGVDPTHDLAGLKSHLTRNGGKVQFGWVLWEYPGWYLEAEFHGVWVSPAGELIDIVPRRDGITSLVFLPDSRRTFQGEAIAHRFLALSRSPDVLAIVQGAELHARLRAEAETDARRASVAPGSAGRNEPCPCGSGLKYKKCCGRGRP